MGAENAGEVCGGGESPEAKRERQLDRIAEAIEDCSNALWELLDVINAKADAMPSDDAAQEPSTYLDGRVA